MKPIAIIPARGGSKGLPRKNVLELAGLPLIGHSINAAKKSGRFHRIVVSTDDNEIAEVSANFGAEVLDRPKHLATDIASSLDVIEHVLVTLSDGGDRGDYFVLLQPTSPLRTHRHIKEAIARFEGSNAKTLVSITECDHHPLKALFESETGDLKPIRDFADLCTPRQSLPPAFVTNGAIYIADWDFFLSSKKLVCEDSIHYKMNREASWDIDSALDLEIAKVLI